MTFSKIISDATRKFKDCVRCGRPVPTWLQHQSDGIVLLETDYKNGLSLLLAGYVEENEVYKELLNESNL
jgi:hypothetical protein